MKRFYIPVLLTLVYQLSFSQVNKIVAIHFRIDLSAEMKNVQSKSSIGIRGNKLPLSWNKTYLLKDEDKDGIYEASINFETIEPEFKLSYKYIHDTATWETSENRIVSTKETRLNLPVDKWNQVEKINTAAYRDSLEEIELYNTITGLDSLLFTAYNNCSIKVYDSLFSENLEFYHDRGGLSTSKKDMTEAFKNNICNKVTRELLKGSIEVSPIPGYGAVEIGSHRFHNKIENVTSGYSKFVVVWQYKDTAWKVTRVISLHK